MIRVLLNFLFKTLALLIPLFLIHTFTSYYIFDSVLWAPNIIGSYIFNFTLAFVIFSGTYFFSLSEDSNSIIFYCMATTLKFILFYFILYPKYVFDGEIQKIEIINFFVPYTACLVIEIYELSRFLNSR